MPVLCVDSLDMTQKVNSVRHLSHVIKCDYYFLDARATQAFGGVDGPAFFSGVRCTGLEEKLTTCSNGGTGDGRCTSAGVTCGKSTSESTVVTQNYLCQL